MAYQDSTVLVVAVGVVAVVAVESESVEMKGSRHDHHRLYLSSLQTIALV